MSNVNTHHFPHGGILVVDDTKSDLKYLSSILRKAGYAVRPASDGELALRSVQARLPAMILLDIQMPDLDGYEVCRRLKDAKDTRDIPVIFISVRTSLLDKVKAFGVGGVDYISKPFEPEEVLARVATHLALWKAQKEIEEKNLQLQQEIAERVRAEEELRESEERFRALVENSSDIVVVLNSDGGIRYRTPSIEYPLGYELGGLVDKNSIELVHPDDLPAVMNALNDAIQNPGVAQHVECRIRHEDGSWRVVEAIGNNLLDNPAVEGIVITARDITERKRAEEELRKYREHLEEMVAERTAELRESEEKLKAQYKGIPVPTYTWQRVGEDLVLVDYNDAAVEITGGGVANFVGTKAAEMYRDRPEIQDELERCFAAKTVIEREMSYRYTTAGESKHLAVKYAFVPPDLVLVHTEDITPRVQAQEEIKKRSAELKQLVDLMAGREIRMAELKDVIRQLRAQLEDAGLTPEADDPLLAG